MKKVMRLVSVQLWAVLADMLSLRNNRKKKPRLLYAGVLLFILAMSAIAFFYCFMIGSGLKMFHCIEILPAMMMAVTCMIVLMTTILKVKGTVFGFRDYDMVMSLPISTGEIVASRLLILYALNMVFVIMIMVPMMIAYGILARPAVWFYLISTVSILFLPFVPIVIASFFGTIIAYVASRFRHNNILNIIFSMGLVVLIVGLSFTVEDNGQKLVDMSRVLTERVNQLYPLAGMYTKAVIHYDLLAFLTFTVISLVVFFLYTIIVQRVFKKINTSIMTGRYHTKFIMKELKTETPWRALYQKEITRYFSSSLYVLNTAFGIVLLTLGTIGIIFVDIDSILGDATAKASIVQSSPIFVSFCVIMCCTTMASISLEGKNLWILKSLPVTPKMIYLSKIAVNLTIISPALFDAVIIGIILNMGFLQTLLMLLVIIACAVFISIYGLLVNLLLPNFNWTSETLVIKQSAAAMIAIFTGMAVVGVQFLFVLVLPSATIAYLSYIVLVVVLDAILYRILMSYGRKRFAGL